MGSARLREPRTARRSGSAAPERRTRVRNAGRNSVEHPLRVARRRGALPSLAISNRTRPEFVSTLHRPPLPIAETPRAPRYVASIRWDQAWRSRWQGRRLIDRLCSDVIVVLEQATSKGPQGGNYRGDVNAAPANGAYRSGGSGSPPTVPQGHSPKTRRAGARLPYHVQVES